MKFVCFTILMLAQSAPAWAAEETLDLNQVSAPAPVESPKPLLSKIKLMGRVDLASEYTPAGNDDSDDENQLKNNHFFIFLKVNASAKTSFMGEIAEQRFFQVDYAHSNRLTWQFGKIMVPFGDTKRFHHYYGGVQGYGVDGVMFANIWAAPGTNLRWDFNALAVDTYMVNAISSDTAGVQDADLQSTRSDRQALGTRATITALNKITFILSGYFADYAGERSVNLAGFDAFTDYGYLNFAKDFKISLGIANAWIESTRPDFQRRGDYFELATRKLPPVDLRLRYGTYMHDSRASSQADTHSINFGGSFTLDVLRILLEYQLNYEAKNEINNDLARAMVSLDF